MDNQSDDILYTFNTYLTRNGCDGIAGSHAPFLPEDLVLHFVHKCIIYIVT